MLCDVDGRRSMAFVATINQNGQERAIGVSRYAPSQNDEDREMALCVADDWRGTGIAELLMSRLISYARAQGLKQLHCVELAENHGMRTLAHALGMQTSSDPDGSDQVIYTLTL